MGPIGAYYEAPGCWDVKDNIFVYCKGNQPATSSCSYTPPYSYTPVSASEVRNNVWNDVGAQGSRIQTVGIDEDFAPAGAIRLDQPLFSVCRNGIRIVSEQTGFLTFRLFSIDGKVIAIGSMPVESGINAVSSKSFGLKMGYSGLCLARYSLNKRHGTQPFIIEP
jgi:hypothetical protein